MSGQRVGFYEAVGYRFSVWVDDPRAGEILRSRLRHLESRRIPVHRYDLIRADDGTYQVLHDFTAVYRTPSPALGLARLLWHCNRTAIERNFDQLLFHAGAVVSNGWGVLLPAPPGSGKSTLVAALMTLGMHYASDEVGALDLDLGRFVPYPKALGLDTMGPIDVPVNDLESAMFLGRDRPVDPVELGGVIARDPFGLQVVVNPEYRPDTACEVTELGTDEALLTLSENCFNLGIFGGEGLQVIADIVDSVSCYRLRYGRVEDAAKVVCELAGVDWPDHEGLAIGETERPVVIADPPCRVDDVTVSYFAGGAGLYDERAGALHVLNSSSVAVWDLVDGSRTIEEIVCELGEATKEPVDRLRVDVERLLAELGALDLLQARPER